MSQIRTANLARAKVMFNKERNLYTIIVAFNVTERTEGGKFKFPPRAKCAYVSGQFTYDEFEKDKQRIVDTARKILRTDLIEFVK